MNVLQSVVEFRSFGNPPDYIYVLGEVIGETIGYLPLRAGTYQTNITRDMRWKEIRDMFYYHNIINVMIDIDPLKIPTRNFVCLKNFQKSKNAREILSKAKKLKSFAYDFYVLAHTYVEVRQFTDYYECRKNFKRTKAMLRKWIRYSAFYEYCLSCQYNCE